MSRVGHYSVCKLYKCSREESRTNPSTAVPDFCWLLWQQALFATDSVKSSGVPVIRLPRRSFTIVFSRQPDTARLFTNPLPVLEKFVFLSLFAGCLMNERCTLFPEYLL